MYENHVLLRRVDGKPGLHEVMANKDEVLNCGHGRVGERRHEVVEVDPHSVVPCNTEKGVHSGDHEH